MQRCHDNHAVTLRRAGDGCITGTSQKLKGFPPFHYPRRQRVSHQAPQKDEGTFASTLRAIVPALIIALVIRTVLFQLVSIPSGSMKPTLLIGDYLAVSKFSYGYSHYSLPFGPPVFSGRVLPALPKRGDIIVFRSPTDEGSDLIKRTIGLPGDRIQVKGGVVYINGLPVTREKIADFVGDDPSGHELYAGAAHFYEQFARDFEGDKVADSAIRQFFARDAK